MDPFLIYLLAINIVTFILFTIDYFIADRNGDEDTGLMDGRILSLFAVAGGAIGMLLALAIWTRRHINKYNIAWWFTAIVFLIIWGFVCAARFGIIDPSNSLDHIFAGWNIGLLEGLGIYLVAMNIATFMVFVVDKRRAESCESRIPEKTLMGLSLLGGSLGGLIAMWLVRHKIHKWYFTCGLPFFIVLHVAMILFLHQAGLI